MLLNATGLPITILQDSIITDKVRTVNHYLGIFQSKGNGQSEQLFVN